MGVELWWDWASASVLEFPHMSKARGKALASAMESVLVEASLLE